MALMKSMSYPERGGVALRYAAALAFVSELIHLWVLPGQLVVAMLPGIFFLLVAMGEGLLAVSLLFGPGRRTVRFGILLNLFVVFVWVFTRVVSVPELLAPVRLPVDGLGAVATVVEVALLMLLVISDETSLYSCGFRSTRSRNAVPSGEAYPGFRH
jgi:hypothetical protein